MSRVDTLPEGFFEKLKVRPPEPGDIIGQRYRLIRHLGKGGMGHVFVAENLAIHRKVAVKVLHAHLLADPEFRARFQQEAEAVAAIDHPNVARFMDLVVGDPTFLVMEFVDGETLSELLKREPRLEVARAVRIAERLCWALDAAHTAGVIHRDLKPSNVIVARTKEGEVPKLIDFGLAKRPEQHSLTRSGQIVGTPAYMSPEQVGSSRVDGRSDVYALACMLFQMVCGRPPFEGTDEMQVLYKQVHDPAPRASSLATVPSMLDEVLARALEKEPAKRFASMAELSAALVACLPQPVIAPIAAPRARPTWLLVTSVALGLLAGGLVVRLATPTAKKGTGGALLVLSRPGGAQVEVDGRTLAETTPTRADDLAPGDHLVRVSRPGLTPIEQHVQLGPAERGVVSVTLPALTRRMQVATSPTNAKVYVDGKLWPSDTPVALELSADEFHEIRLEKNGFEVSTATVVPDDGKQSLELELVRERHPRGTVSIDSNGAAEVWIDGGPSGFTTPTIGLRLAAGPHTIELRDGSGAVGASTKVDVKQGETLHLTLDARRGP